MTALKCSRWVILSNLSFDYMILKQKENQTLRIIYINLLVAFSEEHILQLDSGWQWNFSLWEAAWANKAYLWTYAQQLLNRFRVLPWRYKIKESRMMKRGIMRMSVHCKQISRMVSFHFTVDTVKSHCKILWCLLLCSFVNTTNFTDFHPIPVRCMYVSYCSLWFSSP